ncbi:copper chaperone PCu(A)C [Pseudopontixanthobacter vadosimaris]|uniref:copper chaperone PCu(A)C n=1 Tax=Pseudopontixanthobacter vadosimaris TaxID=2726450 RepID=UPI0014744A72|nr:copper chaperone PCu(A)C [Pseudopontixanthobacter vadosimaris]
MRNTLFAAATLAVSSFGLASCGTETATEIPDAVDGIDGVEISNARIVLGPVAGNPAAVYFDVTYGGDRALTIRAADVEGAGSSAMHQYGEWDGQTQMMEALPVALASGSNVSFEPGGLHVMAMDPPAAWQPGGTAEVTLTVSGGDKVSFPAEIRAAGEER